MLLFQDQAHKTEIDRETEETEETVRKYNTMHHSYIITAFLFLNAILLVLLVTTIICTYCNSLYLSCVCQRNK